VIALMTSACIGAKREERLIRIDGSSTVYPLTKAVAESFQKREPVEVEVKATHEVALAISGTGGGFKLFCRGKTDISNASRPITESEQRACAAQGVKFVEVPVAFDAVAVVVSARNDWTHDITTQELKRIWERSADGTELTWSQIRKGWPDEKLHLFGPGSQSGTRDSFAEAIVGGTESLRSDYSGSEDDTSSSSG
jgi:phosphate transport system substrate-binding protein